jgi:hypothetical protein
MVGLADLRYLCAALLVATPAIAGDAMDQNKALSMIARSWSFTVTGPLTRSDRVATLEEAKAQFRKSWDAWKVWAKLEEIS